MYLRHYFGGYSFPLNLNLGPSMSFDVGVSCVSQNSVRFWPHTKEAIVNKKQDKGFFGQARHICKQITKCFGDAAILVLAGRELWRLIVGH